MESEVIIAQLQERDFYLKKPQNALINPWLWVLVFFPLASTVGLAILAFFGFGFIELDAILPIHAALTWLAATALAIGEMGSFFATIEVFRKYGRGESRWWDWVAVVISGLTTISAVAVGYAWITKTEAWWLMPLKENTPLVLSFLAVLDTILAGSEAGLYLSQESREIRDWRKKYEQWARRQEKTIEHYQNMIWRVQEAQWDAALSPENAPQSEAYTGPTERCWCGAEYPQGAYEAHIIAAHVPEIAGYANGAEALAFLKQKYEKGTKHFPTEAGLESWLSRFIQRRE